MTALEIFLSATALGVWAAIAYGERSRQVDADIARWLRRD